MTESAGAEAAGTGPAGSGPAGAVAADGWAIVALQNAYAVAIDRKDWAALRGCFAPDATISFGMPLGVGNLDEFMEWAPEFHGQLARTLHQLSTHQVAVRGEVAAASCYLHALLIDATRENATSVFGRYDDELVRAGDHWAIRRRRFRPAWVSTSVPAQGPQE
jgi:hypothetical protein